MKELVFAVAAVSSMTLAAGVPEPQPVESKVEITALYYPGTEQMSEWDMVAQTRPEWTSSGSRPAR